MCCLIKGDDVSTGLQVRFWNGITMDVPKDLAVWIPASLHEQMIKNLHHYSSRSCCRRVSYCSGCFNFPSPRCIHHGLSYIPPCQCSVKTCWPMVTSPPPLNNQGREDLERKIDLQLKELQRSSQQTLSSQSSDDEEIADEKRRPSRSEMMSRSINTDISCLKKPYTPLEVKPAWRYWKRGSPEPQHKQPGTF